MRGKFRRRVGGNRRTVSGREKDREREIREKENRVQLSIQPSPTNS